MSNFVDVSRFNELIGNPKGNLEQLDWDAVEAQFALVHEEVLEILEAIQERDIQKLRDGTGDTLVTTYGLAHRAGIHADADMLAIQKSNMSKFCLSSEEARLTARKYEALGLEVMFRYPSDGIISVVSAKDQYDREGKFFPKGKLLKGINFHEPVFI